MTSLGSKELMDELMHCDDWFGLHSLREPRDNQLEILIVKFAPNRSKAGLLPDSLKDRPELSFLAEGSCPIEPIPGCKKYRLYWGHYAAYLVTKEMVGSCGNYDGERWIKIIPDIKTAKRRRIDIKGDYHRCYMMNFEIEADPKLIEFSYDCGLGEKNSMGFGMIETNVGGK